MSPRFLNRAVAAALSRGYGYEPHEAGTRYDNGGYYIDYRPKIESHLAHPELALGAADTAQLALGWHERALLGDASAADEFSRLADGLARSGEAASEAAGDALVWPYSVPLPKYAAPIPWYSAMAQGQIASVFTRAFQLQSDARWADLARRALAPVLTPGPHGFLTETPDGPVLEEVCPTAAPSHILNGWIFALWGVRDVALKLGDDDANRLLGETTDCLMRTLPRYDTGRWSRYSLYPHPRTDLAKPFYHRLHITQLSVLHALTGIAAFLEVAQRWRSYDTRWAATTSIASKVPFVLANRAQQRRATR